MDFADNLVKKNIKCIGLDSPSPDTYHFAILKKLFALGIFIVENLRNLKALMNKYPIELFVFPLRVRGDASLVRAVARIPYE
jgi:kynurenine formamidase